ncbi:hypothetical protein PMAYCL1PPCAC_26078, partial [Pristionchus mayeri]
ASCTNPSGPHTKTISHPVSHVTTISRFFPSLFSTNLLRLAERAPSIGRGYNILLSIDLPSSVEDVNGIRRP